MRIYDLRSATGELHAFEISNLFVSRSRACKIAASVPGVELMKAEKSWFGSDVFCQVRLGSTVIEIEEPFGDNSRFLVSGNPPGWSAELAQVREAFATRPTIDLFWRKRSRHAV
jgi:hypothetical protein